MSVNSVVADATKLLGLVNMFFGSAAVGVAMELLKGTKLFRGLTPEERASVDENYAKLVAEKAAVDADIART